MKEIPVRSPSAKLEAMLKELDSLSVSGLTASEIEVMMDKFGLKQFTGDLFRLQTFVHIVIVFSAMCLESLINDYAVVKKSAAFFKKEIAPLSTYEKWEKAPLKIAGKKMDAAALSTIKKLFQLRNKLVHPKSMEFNNTQWRDKTVALWVTHVNAAFHAVKLAASSLYSIDSSFTYLEEYKWMWEKPGKSSSAMADFFNSQWGFKE
jgi:hypothetical protein